MGASVFQIMAWWEQAGGNPTASPMMAAIAMAESGGNPDAVSPTDDYGLWQINTINFDGATGLGWGNWSDPVANARAAIALSGNGSNVAAWCTCWQDPAANCGHGYLSAPQPGTPAGNWLDQIAQDTNTPIPGSTVATADPSSGLQAAWGEIMDTVNTRYPQQYDQLQAMNGLLEGF